MVMLDISGLSWGYADGYNTSTNTVYVRDVAIPSPINPAYDRTFFMPAFFSGSPTGQILIIK